MISMIGGAGSGYASIFRVRKATKPRPRKAANATITSSRRERQNAIRLRSIDGLATPWSLAPLVVDEDRPLRDHRFSGVEPLANLRQAILLDPDVDHAAFEQHRFGFDPHGRDIPLAY